MKVVENSPQNARKCTILKNFLGGGDMPPNPPSKGSQLRGMYIQNPRNFKVGTPPSLGNHACAPDVVYMYIICSIFFVDFYTCMSINLPSEIRK